ncbi:hypothetical protein PGB90_008159 [Kerria lacca]
MKKNIRFKYQLILDTAIININECFNQNMSCTFAYLNSNNFNKINEEILPVDPFQSLSKMVIKI